MPNPTNLKNMPAPRHTAPGRVERTHKHPDAAPSAAPKAKPKERRRQCATEQCARCGLALKPGEPAYLVKDQTVCGTCHATRQASLVAAALTAPRLAAPDEAPAHRRPWWGRALSGTCALVYCPVTVVGQLSRNRRRRRQQAALTPLLDQLHRVAHRA